MDMDEIEFEEEDLDLLEDYEDYENRGFGYHNTFSSDGDIFHFNHFWN